MCYYLNVHFHGQRVNIAEGGTCTNGSDVSNHGMFDVRCWSSAGIRSDRKYNKAGNLTSSIPV